jgi:diguanylate cyclase (GGDEF)-like protein
MKDRRRRTRLLHWSDWPLLAKGLVVVFLPMAALLVSRVAIVRAQAAGDQADRIARISTLTQNRIAAVQTSLLNAETGVRGYLLTRDPTFLEPYRLAQRSLGPGLDDLEKAFRIDGDGLGIENVARLRVETASEMAVLDDLATDGPAQSPAAHRVTLNTGKSILDGIRAQMNEMNARERDELAEESASAARIQRQTKILATIGFPIGVLGGVLGLWLFAASISRRVHRVREGADRLGRGERVEPGRTSRDEIGALEDAVGLADAILAERQASLDLALEAGRLGLFEVDERSGAISSPAPERLEALGLAGDRPLETVDDLIQAVHQSDRLWLAGTWERFLVNGGSLDAEFRLRDPEGDPRWLALRARVEETEAGRRIIGAVFDISDRKADEAERRRLYAEVAQHRQELAKLSITDDVTNLLNRRGFHLLAGHEIAHADRTGDEVLLLFADLDGLKAINDTHGHATGTRALVDMADVLRETFRGSDVIARFGGDEFCILLSRSLAGTSELKAIDRLQRAIRERNANGDRPYVLSASVGACRRPSGSSMTLEQMTKRADELMYKEKHRRRVARPSAAPADVSIVRV